MKGKLVQTGCIFAIPILGESWIFEVIKVDENVHNTQLARIDSNTIFEITDATQTEPLPKCKGINIFCRIIIKYPYLVELNAFKELHSMYESHIILFQFQINKNSCLFIYAYNTLDPTDTYEHSNNVHTKVKVVYI